MAADQLIRRLLHLLVLGPVGTAAILTSSASALVGGQPSRAGPSPASTGRAAAAGPEAHMVADQLRRVFVLLGSCLHAVAASSRLHATTGPAMPGGVLATSGEVGKASEEACGVLTVSNKIAPAAPKRRARGGKASRARRLENFRQHKAAMTIGRRSRGRRVVG